MIHVKKDNWRTEYNDLEDMVFSMQLTYPEVVEILDTKYVDASCTGYTLEPGIYEISDINIMLKSLFPDEVEVSNTTDDIRLSSNLTTNETIRFAEKIVFLPYIKAEILYEIQPLENYGNSTVVFDDLLLSKQESNIDLFFQKGVTIILIYTTYLKAIFIFQKILFVIFLM